MYINHEFALKITNQITLIIINIDKLNLRFVRVFDYIQRFNLNIRHKSNKQHILFDVLFRLVNDNINSSIVRNFDENELNALFIVTFVKMNSNFKQRIFDEYKSNFN